MPSSASQFPQTLQSWLTHAERLHPRAIDLSLERVLLVAERLQLRLRMPVITVAGTNGKGSTSTMLEAMLRAAGWRTGLYTSPHLLRFNERCRIDGREVHDEVLLQHLEAVESARGSVPLTYFEFTTLAILRLFGQSGLDAVVLEVGLGGRLDAVNIVDADCAVLTSVGIDHVDYLGDDRESIGREKAGVCRAGQPFVVADPDPPAAVLAELERLRGCPIRVGHDYTVSRQADGPWCWEGLGVRIPDLPRPSLGGDHQISNAAAAVAALVALRHRLTVPVWAMAQGLATVRLPGRLQIVAESPCVVLDVGHNVHAARALAVALGGLADGGKVHAVFGAMKDKDLHGIIAALRGIVGSWYLCALDTPRAASIEQLMTELGGRHDVEPAGCFADPLAALDAARQAAGSDDVVIAFGSFHTVAPILTALDQSENSDLVWGIKGCARIAPCQAEVDKASV